jgi:hypothetical protein
VSEAQFFFRIFLDVRDPFSSQAGMAAHEENLRADG